MDKVLLVTGGSSDIGAELIRRVGQNYDKVICHYHSSEAVVESLRALLGDRLVPLKADFSSLEETQGFVQTILHMGLNPTHFVHLSSDPVGSLNLRFSKSSWEDFQHELDVAFRPAVLCCQAFVPLMAKNGGGRVAVMLSSHVQWEPHKAYAAPYTCAKHALLGLVKALSAEYAGKGVTVNAVSPSMIDTKFLRGSEHVKEANVMASPLHRLLTVEDVVPAFEYLLSPAAAAVTGQNLAVTGGL